MIGGIETKGFNDCLVYSLVNIYDILHLFGLFAVDNGDELQGLGSGLNLSSIFSYLFEVRLEVIDLPAFFLEVNWQVEVPDLSCTCIVFRWQILVMNDASVLNQEGFG